MFVALTGTPGTGKTTVARILPYPTVDLNALVKEEGLHFGWDIERGCLEADMEALAASLEAMESEDVTILEGHLSHHLALVAVVLRLNPKELSRRLSNRGYPPAKIRENVEAEALDVILVEAVERCQRVYEVDTTGLLPEEVADLVAKAIRGEAELPPRGMGWLEEMELDLG